MPALNAIATGLERGATEYGENVRRMKALERDDQRFEWEKNAEADKQKARDAQDEYAKSLQQIQVDTANGRLPGVELTEEGKAAVAKGDESYARAEDRRFGLTPPQAAQQPGRAPAEQSASMTPREQNLFRSGGEGLYANQKQADDVRYQRIYDATAKYLSATGQVDKLFDLQKRVNDMREQGYEPMRKAAAAAVAMGDPNAINLVAKASQVSGTPYNIDPAGAEYDREKQMWKNVKVIGPDGKAEVKDMTATQLLAGISALSPEAAIASQFARVDAANKDKREDFKAETDRIQADAYSRGIDARAGADRETKTALAEQRRRDADRKEDENAQKQFISSFGYKEIEPKTKDEVEALLPDQQKAYAKAREEQSQRRQAVQAAMNIYSLNERAIPAAQVAQLVPSLIQRMKSGKGADGVDEKTGLPFVNYNGKRVLLPRD